MGPFRDLDAWRVAMALTEDVYDVTRRFPADERFGLISQLRRAAVSVPSNVAEGQARNHRKEFANHLSIARGSLAEVETQLELAFRIGYLSEADLIRIMRRLNSAAGLVTNLMRSLQ